MASVALSPDPVSVGENMYVTALTNLSLVKHEPILQLSPFPAGESWQGWTCLPVLASPWQILSAWFFWIWLSFIMANVLRLPASANCLQTGEGASKKSSTVAWNHSKSRWETGLCFRQGQPCLPVKEPDFSSWIPSWHLTEDSCPSKGAQALLLDHTLSLVHLKQRNKALLKVQPCQTQPGVFVVVLVLFWFFNLKGILRQTEN